MTVPPHSSRIAGFVAALGAAATLAACSSSGSGGGASSPPAADTASASAPAPTSSATTSSAASSATSSSATDTSDFTSLLIPASAIPLSGVTRGTPQALPQGKGIAARYDAPNSRTIGDTIVVFDTAALAKTAYTSSVAAAKSAVTSPQVSSAPIGSGGTAIRGTSSQGEVAVLVFAEGRATVVLEFDSTAGDPVPTALVQQVAIAQDNKIKSGLS